MQVAASPDPGFAVAPAVSQGIAMLSVGADWWGVAARGSRRPRPRGSGSGHSARVVPPSEPETEAGAHLLVPGHSVTAYVVIAGVRTCALSLSVPPLLPSDLRSSDKLVAPAQPMGAPRLPATVRHGPRQNREGNPRTSAGAFGKGPVSTCWSHRGRQGAAAGEGCVTRLPAALTAA